MLQCVLSRVVCCKVCCCELCVVASCVLQSVCVARIVLRAVCSGVRQEGRGCVALLWSHDNINPIKLNSRR